MKPICLPCERFMRPKRNGFYFVEGMPTESGPDVLLQVGKGAEGWKPYKIWVGDLYECPTCKAQQIAGVGQRPLVEHYQPGFAEVMERTDAMQLFVKDC